MDEELFLPVLSHFENGNFWTAIKPLVVKAATQHTAIHCWMEFVTAI